MQEQARLREEIEQAIAQDPRISGKIDVEVNERHVRLTGVVSTLEERELAEEIAKNIAPIQLENDIVIESTKVIEDEEVLKSARKAIAKYPDLAHDIGVERVVEGVAYLKGHSDSISKVSKVAEIIAESPGVKDVVSEVKIRPEVSISDIDLVDEVEQALNAMMPEVAAFIDVTAKKGIVSLYGDVQRIDQRIQASNIAKDMPGVIGVINNLNVSRQPTSFDLAIENEVIEALEADKINLANVRVNVLDGVVYLDGTVDSIKQRDRAREVASSILGVRYVQNDLVVGFHIEPKAA
ncbi:MAG: BON domain-containing protein [Actinomycetota bacterium]|nr:BON domain-containing protein [Actinomycetota bacterium]